MLSCERCGHSSDDLQKRVDRGGKQLCLSCTARPAKRIQSAYGTCKPHAGEFDDDDNPLTPDGKFYRPGIRLCGNRDCVERAHIRKAK
jgi:hypothetical protein